jgi:hypothetical protein
MGKALRQAAFALVTLSAVALVLSTGIVGSTFAIFNGETQNAASSFAGGWIDPPASVAATASGYDVGFTWTPGTHGPVTGQTLYWANNTTSSNCTGAGYTAIAPSFTAALAAYTDSNRGATANGNWFCYRLVSTSATAWTAQVDKVLQVGLAATAVALTNGGTAASIDAGDKITLTFNQRTNLAASGTTKVCVITPGLIILGDTAGGTGCSSSDGYTVGQLTGEALGHNQVYRFSTFTTSSIAPWTMTITLVGGGSATYSGTTTFVPSPSILSAATTHQAALCTSAAATCRPTTTSLP